jgi:branched-subunit amino acid aminotransferase/4-amino-4-deoxychorismate lyase
MTSSLTSAAVQRDERGSLRDEFPWANPQLKQQLAHDPIAVLKERGINVSPSLPRQIVEQCVRIAYLLWVDGRIVPLDQFNIDPLDEGLLFGRGAWESTRTVHGVPWLWPLHLDRLRQTAQVLHIDLAPDRLPDTKQVSEYVRALTDQDVVIRLNVSAGRPGARGLVWMSASLRPTPIESVRLKTVASPVHKGQAYLTLKTFQYATRLRIGQQAAQAGFDSALLLDHDGNLLEASHANLFVRFRDGWATPKADGGFLPGTLRHFLLERSPKPIREQTMPLAQLADAQEVFVTNSNVGIVPVTQIDDQRFAIGPDTQDLIQWLRLPAAEGYFLEPRGVMR